ncbi:MAG: AAA family ATPase [Lachnospiraceae bacterium]|nr:AAA family ATPase [Lachnospiraceae bacterium]
MLNEYYREGSYEKVVALYAGIIPEEISEENVVMKVAESYRRLGRVKEAALWMERLVELRPQRRQLEHLSRLYLKAGASMEQWKKLLTLSVGQSREAEAIARYFYEKQRGAESARLEELAQKMLEEAITYEDAIYFEAANYLDRNYCLQQILAKSRDEENKKKAQQMLRAADKNTQRTVTAIQEVKRVKRKVPEAVEKLFADMIGVEEIKEEIGALYQHLLVNRNRIDRIAVPFNFVISGQVGSGKTKLAYIITELLYQTGISKKREPLEISALSLMESMTEVLEDAPPVVIINHAEYLWSTATQSEGGGEGKNQIWPILEQLLEDACLGQEHFYLFLGEATAMDSFISNNSKIKNFVTYLKIPVYSGSQLHQIGLQMIEKDDYEISEEGKEQFYQELRKKSVLGDFANGHTILQVLIEAKKNLAYRVAKEGGARCYEDRDFVMQDKQEESLEELREKLNSLIGLDSVKEEVNEKIALFEAREKNRREGSEDEEAVSLNTLLLGPPGTGKTTVARLLGKIYGQIGILPRGDIFVEVTRDGLVAGYSGQTALKVDEVVKKAMGGVLFIDEAYNLVTGDNDEFGKEAFNTLLTRAENYRDRLMVIMAGYEEPMGQLLSVNEGMTRRFPHQFHFADYKEEELMEILYSMLEKRRYYLHTDAEVAVKRLIRSRMSRHNFGNAGEIRNMLEGMLQKLAVRVLNQKIEQSVDRRTIRKTDVEEYIGHETEKEKTLDDYLDELNHLIGMEDVKKHIMDEIKSAKIAQERARRAGVSYSPGSLHMLLVGNAGTGKTTVARLIGKIYGKAGLIKNENVFVEIRRESLVAGYMGQTGGKVRKEVERAKGGIMFIDEAYNLVNGDHDEFGKDALNTLLAPIENNREDLMVIMAGYEEEMEGLLNRNQGLRSRLNTKLTLEDYSMEEMVRIFYKKAELEGYRLDKDLKDCVAAYITREQEKAYPDFGNARGVRNCFEAVVKRMNARLAANGEILLSERKLQQLSDEELSTIRREDIEN